MALSRNQKVTQLSDLQKKLEESKSVIFAHYIGLTVSEVSDFREKLREQEAEMKVSKKTLLRQAIKSAGMPELKEEDTPGPVACIFSFSDPVAGAQTAAKLGKKMKQIQIVGGIFDGKVLSTEEAKAFANLPTREVLLATFASMIRSPISSFASAISNPLQQFAVAAKERAKQMESA